MPDKGQTKFLMADGFLQARSTMFESIGLTRLLPFQHGFSSGTPVPFPPFPGELARVPTPS